MRCVSKNLPKQSQNLTLSADTLTCATHARTTRAVFGVDGDATDGGCSRSRVAGSSVADGLLDCRPNLGGLRAHHDENLRAYSTADRSTRRRTLFRTDSIVGWR